MIPDPKPSESHQTRFHLPILPTTLEQTRYTRRAINPRGCIIDKASPKGRYRQYRITCILGIRAKGDGRVECPLFFGREGDDGGSCESKR
jgi:hypothetical protein